MFAPDDLPTLNEQGLKEMLYRYIWPVIDLRNAAEYTVLATYQAVFAARPAPVRQSPLPDMFEGAILHLALLHGSVEPEQALNYLLGHATYGPLLDRLFLIRRRYSELDQKYVTIKIGMDLHPAFMRVAAAIATAARPQ